MQEEMLVERLDPSELGVAARVLAEAYTEDPVHLWAMPKAATRLEDATVFFTLFLRWMRRYSWDVFGTADRSAVVVTWLVCEGKRGYPDGVRYMPPLLRARSHANEFFRWVDTFRPKFNHRYLEFIGALPTAPLGTGLFLLENVLRMCDREGLPVWAWSSNPRNLPFYRRLGFEIGTELHWHENAPHVTT
ncbi:MAG: hypothetical protein P8Y94_12185, partial [Acidobacteriota bacterium]